MAEGLAARRRAAPEGCTFSWLAAADGRRLRVAAWTPASARRGTVLVLQGRREFIEKYYETVADLLDRGFAVAALDWRGQGLSDRLLADRHKGHVGDFAEYVSDLGCFIAWVRARCPGPYALLAHSMGGHIAARCLASDAAGIARAVWIAPMIGIRFGPLPEAAANLIARAALALGRGESYALMQGPYTEADRQREADLLSSDRDRLEDEIVLCRSNPDLALGGVTYGWVMAALESVAHLRMPGVAEAITAPVLIVLAGEDQVVANADIQAFAARLPDGRVTTIAGARHEVLKERDEFRTQFWAAFDAFM